MRISDWSSDVCSADLPTIVFPEVPKSSNSFPLDVVGVAWDFSRAAARAVADALPVLQRAKTIRVVTITQEKTIDTRQYGEDLAKYLAWHGIEVELEEEGAAGRTAGSTLKQYDTHPDRHST